jgi:hypothetical protein
MAEAPGVNHRERDNSRLTRLCHLT